MGPDPNYLFSSAKDGNVRLVDLRKGELSSFLFSSPVNCLKTDGQSILAGLSGGKGDLCLLVCWFVGLNSWFPLPPFYFFDPFSRIGKWKPSAFTSF